MKKLLAAPIILTSLMMSGCGVVESYESGMVSRFGKIVEDNIHPGLCIYNPLWSSLLTVDLRESVQKYSTTVFTSDIQSADVILSVTYRIDPSKVKEIYSTVGLDSYRSKLVDPVAVSVLKDVAGHYEADKMVSNREKITDEIFNELQESLAGKGVIVSKVNIINIDYSDAFEKSVEEKQVALQASIRAKNETIRIEEEAKQAVVKAKAEAEAIKIKNEAIEQGKGVIYLEAIKKWDGKLPDIITSSVIPLVK